MKIGDPVDIFVGCYLRQYYTEKTISYLFERTQHPFRLFVINQGGNDELVEELKKQNKLFLGINFTHNTGVHAMWNTALALAESEYFITTDNDIYAPKLEPDWLTQLIGYMNDRPDYGAISLHPHFIYGAKGIDVDDPEDVKERNMCGGVLRIMRTEAVRKAGGWEHVIRTSRNHEERTICSRLQTAGYKTGICSRIRAYHPYGRDVKGNLGWGYTTITPEEQGHNPAFKDDVLRFDNPDAYDNNTWMPK